MKKNLKRRITAVLTIFMLLSSSIMSIADTYSNIEGEKIIEPKSNNRYRTVYVRGETKTTRRDISASEARDQDLAHYAAVGILAAGGPIGIASSIVALLGNAIYDMNVAGYVLTEVTVVKKYKEHRLTGKRHYDSSRTEMNVKVYAAESNGYSLHRSFSWNFRNK